MKSSISIFAFSEVFISFKSFRLKGTELCWWDKDSVLVKDTYKANSQAFLNDFSYMTVSSSDELKGRLVFEDEVVVNAEIYGGSGIGGNAGGVRCGLIHGFQVKGIGINPLIGCSEQASHSNGTLNLIDGALEVIYAKILGMFLPNGAVQVPALIYTGHNTAYSNHVQGHELTEDHGCMLVREAALRPAHFMYCEHYSGSLPELSDSTKSSRISSLYQRMKVECEGHEQVVNLVCHFLSSSAEQFAFAKIFGLMHGTLSFSNMSLDGRWLDLTCATFVDGYSNCSVSTAPGVLPFLQEHGMIPEAARRLIWEYSKQHSLNLNFEPLEELFVKQFSNESWLSFLKFWFITDEVLFEKLAPEDINKALKLFLKSSIKGTKIEYRSPCDVPDINLPLQFSISVLSSISSATSEPKIVGLTNMESAFFVNFMRNIFSIYSARTDTAFLNLISQTAVRIIRRSAVLVFFYRANIIEILKELINRSSFDVTSISLFIDKCIEMFSWGVIGSSDTRDKILLAKHNDTHIWWNISAKFNLSDYQYTESMLKNMQISSEREVAVFNYYLNVLKIYSEGGTRIDA